jgi:hypothetical protein
MSCGRDHLWATARAERFEYPYEFGRIVALGGRDRDNSPSICRSPMTGVYFLAFSLAGPEASLTARLATAAH